MIPQATFSALSSSQSKRTMRSMLDAQRSSFNMQGAPDYFQRIEALDVLLKGLLGKQKDFVQAISADFGGRATEETLLLEIFPVVNQIRHTRRNLKRWMRPTRVAPGWHLLPARARIVHQPLGVVGIIGAWNYPLALNLSPLVCAIAAGNHAMIKPSELAPRTGLLLKSLLAEIFPPEYVKVVPGNAEATAEFSSLPFDHLLFTGPARIGKQVMRAASRNLTPVTLELGGKSPALVHPSYPLERAVERILTGKLYNAGQSCVAPDYVLLHERSTGQFLKLAEQITRRLYPQLVNNPDYTRIINLKHYDRLSGLVAEAQEKRARVLQVNPSEESCDSDNRVFPPTLLYQVHDSARVMQEEIFGPILPIVTYREEAEALRYINERPRPLALFYFDRDPGRIKDVMGRTVVGGVTVNDVLFHIGQNNLPFGGVGPSGMGHYRGIYGFETFSKKKPIRMQSRFSFAGLFRPPYNRTTKKLLKFLIGK